MQRSINGRMVEVLTEPEMPILWMLRDALHLTPAANPLAAQAPVGAT